MDVPTIGPFILESSQALRAFQGSGTGFGPDQTHANMMLRRNKICRYHATTAVMTTAIAVSITTRSSTILHAPILVTLNNSVSSAGPRRALPCRILQLNNRQKITIITVARDWYN